MGSLSSRMKTHLFRGEGVVGSTGGEGDGVRGWDFTGLLPREDLVVPGCFSLCST